MELPAQLDTLCTAGERGSRQTDRGPDNDRRDLTEPPRPSAIVLKVVCSDATPENKLSLTLNDAPLSDPHPSDRWQTERLGPGDLWESATAFSTGLDPDQLEPGRNKVSLSVEMGEVVAHTVEVHVTY